MRWVHPKIMVEVGAVVVAVAEVVVVMVVVLLFILFCLLLLLLFLRHLVAFNGRELICSPG